ncbi:hypothetical protein [Sphaerisporangium sp. NPDC051011]
MSAKDELEKLIGAMAAVEPEATESDEDENGNLGWTISYTTYRA